MEDPQFATIGTLFQISSSIVHFFHPLFCLVASFLAQDTSSNLPELYLTARGYNLIWGRTITREGQRDQESLNLQE